MNHTDDPDDDDIPSAATPPVTGTSLADHGIYYLCDSITGATCKPVISWIIEEGFKRKHERLTLFVSSYGGEAYACFALIDAIMGSAIPIDTVGLGYIASAGLMIFIHGKRRFLTNHTYIMAHQHAGQVYGKQHELIARRKEDDWLGERIKDMFVKHSKLTRKQVGSILLGPSDTFLTAKEAVKYGLADEIKL